MTNQPRVLITGVTGLLGNSLAKEVSNYGQVYGIARHNCSGQLFGQMFATDLLNPIELKTLINKIEPDIVIHAAALASVGWARRAIPARDIKAPAAVCLALPNSLLTITEKDF